MQRHDCPRLLMLVARLLLLWVVERPEDHPFPMLYPPHSRFERKSSCTLSQEMESRCLKSTKKLFRLFGKKAKTMNSIILSVFWLFQYIPCYLIQNDFGGFLGNHNSWLASLHSLWFLTNSHLFCNFNTNLSQKRFTAHLRFKGVAQKRQTCFTTQSVRKRQMVGPSIAMKAVRVRNVPVIIEIMKTPKIASSRITLL